MPPPAMRHRANRSVRAPVSLLTPLRLFIALCDCIIYAVILMD
jgi:hypothetical protein